MGLLAGGGLQKLIAGFQQNGLGDVVASWILPGPIKPVSPEQVTRSGGFFDPRGDLLGRLRRVLPKRAGEALFEHRPPREWKLEVERSAEMPEKLLVAATILAIEMALW